MSKWIRSKKKVPFPCSLPRKRKQKLSNNFRRILFDMIHSGTAGYYLCAMEQSSKEHLSFLQEQTHDAHFACIWFLLFPLISDAFSYLRVLQSSPSFFCILFVLCHFILLCDCDVKTLLSIWWYSSGKFLLVFVITFLFSSVICT